MVNDKRAAFIAPTDDLKEQVGALFIDGEIAQLIQYQQTGFEILAELGLESPGGLSGGEGIDDIDGGGEEHRIACQASGMAEGNTEMAFPQTLPRRGLRYHRAGLILGRNLLHPMRLELNGTSAVGSINAKYFPFFLGKIYLSISHAAPILSAFLSHSRYVVCSARIEGDGLQNPAEMRGDVEYFIGKRSRQDVFGSVIKANRV
jgi:hypothetical protein